MTKEGWVCPKCGRVWSPDSPQCWPCNSAKDFQPTCESGAVAAVGDWKDFMRHGKAIAEACKGGRE